MSPVESGIRPLGAGFRRDERKSIPVEACCFGYHPVPRLLPQPGGFEGPLAAKELTKAKQPLVLCEPDVEYLLLHRQAASRALTSIPPGRHDLIPDYGELVDVGLELAAEVPP